MQPQLLVMKWWYLWQLQVNFTFESLQSSIVPSEDIASGPQPPSAQKVTSIRTPWINVTSVVTIRIRVLVEMAVPKMTNTSFALVLPERIMTKIEDWANYHRIWLISACAYSNKWKGNMRPINEMRLYTQPHPWIFGHGHKQLQLCSNCTIAVRPNWM